MYKRAQAIDVLINRIKSERNNLDIKSLKLNPVAEIHESDMPALVLLTAEDTIIKTSSKNVRGTPMIRALTIKAELIVNRKTDKRDMLKTICLLRDVILDDPYPLYNLSGLNDRTAFFFEMGTDGPFPYRISDIEGMQLLIGLRYEDDGTYN